MLNAGPPRERRLTEDSISETVNAVNGIKEDTLVFKVAKQLDSSFLVCDAKAQLLRILYLCSRRLKELEKSFLELIQKTQKGYVRVWVYTYVNMKTR